MDTGLNMNNRGQQFELQFPPIDPSSYEGPNSFSDAGPTRTRRSRPHSITPYSRNNNNNNFSTQADVTSKNWLHALISNFLPSFMSKFLGLTGSRREGRRGETAPPRLDQKNDNEMDIDQQHQEGSNGIQERLVQSNRIFMESIQPTNGLSPRIRRRSEMTQNNSIKRKRSETSIEAVEENLRRKAQIEDQNHKPDLKELYYKNIDPNWYKPFKNNPDNYPKFASSSRVTSDTYGPDQNLNLPKESPPLKKFKPSVIPTPRWFDYYPDKDEDIIDKRRTENIVEKRKAEEKTIEKEKALHKSKKGKEKDINFENGREKSGTKLVSPIHVSPLNDRNYFDITAQTPVIVSSPQMIVSPIENRPPIVGSSKISITTEDKGKSIVTTPDTTAQSIKSPSSMESIVYTHENDKSSLEKTPVTSTLTHLAVEIKRQSTNIGNNDVGNNDSSQTTIPLVTESKNDTSTPLIVSEKNDGQTLEPLLIEPDKDIEKEALKEKTKSTLTIVQDTISANSVISLPKDNQSLSLSPFTTLTSNKDTTSNNNTLTSSSIFGNMKGQPPITILSNDTKETGKTHKDEEEKERDKAPITQPKENIGSEKNDGQGATITLSPFFPMNSSTADSKTDSPLVSPFTPTAVSTTALTSLPSFSFGHTSSEFGSSTFPNNSNNNIEKPDRSSKSRRPYNSSMSSRNKKNRRGFGTSGMSSASSFGSGNENTSSQQSWGIQTQQTPSSFASIFNTTASATPMFGQSHTSASSTGFNTNSTVPVFGANPSASTTTFSFGTSTSIGFSNPSYSGTFPNSQSSAAVTGFTQMNFNFNNSIMQNGQPNNLSFQEQTYPGFGPSQSTLTSITQPNYIFNPLVNGASTNPISFSGSEVGQGNQAINNNNSRKIRKMRPRTTKP